MALLTAFLLASTLVPAPEAPTGLVGEWRYTSIRGVSYYDSSTGQYLGDGGGVSDTYVLAADGTYKEYFYMKNSPTAGWTTQIFTTTEGKWSVKGDQVSLTVTKGNYRVADNRVQRSNYTRPMTDDEVKKAAKTYRFTQEKDGAHSLFVIHLNDKETLRYELVEKKG